MNFHLKHSVTRIVLIVAVGIGIAVDAFFAIVNFYPVAPHPDPGPKRYVVMQLDEVQAKWFQTHILEDFNAETNSNLEVLPVAEEEQLQAVTHDAAKAGKDIVLTALPETQLARAVQTKLVRPFSDVVTSKQIAADFDDLGAPVMAIGKISDAQYFLPRMAVIDVAAYRVSKVRDAVSHWSVLRPQIDAALARINGHGLPAGYELGLTPSAWTSYDLFVMAYYWSRRSYGGQPARPRVAHRTGDEIDGQRDIVSALYRLGASDDTVATFGSRAAIDFFEWETLYRDEGAYVTEMFAEEPFDDEAVLEGLKSGELYFAPIDTMEAFNLHGGSHESALARVDDPSDLEFTSMPRGASLALDAKNHPQRVRPSFSFIEDWVWALPAETRSTVGYQLVRFLWRPDIHARECEALGMLPLHPLVVAERVSRFRLDWMSHVFDAGLEQAQFGERTPPALIAKGIGSVYALLWNKIVRGSVPPTPESGIVEALRQPPKPVPLAIVHAATTAKPPAEPPEASAPQTESEDWESDVVLERALPRGSAAK
jgi:hypothetical protein